MQGQELQTREQTPLVSPYARFGGDPWSPVVDFMLPDQLPMLKVVHPNSKGVPEGVPPGKLFNVVTQEIMSTYRCVLLYARPGQIAFPDAFSGDNKHLCRSRDGLQPTGDGSDPQPGPCRACDDRDRLADCCPWLRWREDAGSDKPPRCATTYDLLLWQLEGDSGAVLSVMRRAARSFQSLKSALRGRKHMILRRYEGQDVQSIPYNVLAPIEVSTTRETTPRGAYFVPTFTILDENVDLVWARQLAGSVNGLVGRVQAADLVGDTSGGPTAGKDADDLPF